MADARELEVILKARDEATRVIEGTVGRLQSVGQGLVSVGKTLTAAVTILILAAGGASVKTFADVEKGMNEVFTLLPGISKDAMGQMTQQVIGFSKEFGVLPKEVIPALYQSLSAGVPPDNVFEFMATAQKAAMGGVTDLQTAVDGISSTVNAFRGQALSASEASDLIFTAVRLGKTTVDELSRSLFNVNPVAAAAGVKFSNVTAALAAMTAQGVPTSVATTQLRQLIVELSKSGTAASDTFKKLAGKTFRDFIASGGDLAGALAIMEEGARKSNKGINDLFSSVEAGNAALALSGDNIEVFRNALDQMAQSAGATDAAYAQMDQGISRTMQRLRATLAVAAYKAGEALAPLVERALPHIEALGDKIVALIERFKELDPRWQKLMLGAAGAAAALGPVILAAGKVMSAVSSLGGVFGKVLPVLTRIPGMLGPVGVALGALALVAKYIFDHWDKYGPMIMPVIERLMDAMSKLADTVMGAFNRLWDQLAPLIPKLVDAFIPLVDTIVRVAAVIIDAFVKVMPAVERVITALAPLIGQVVTAVADLATRLAPLIQLIGDLFADIVEMVAPIIPQIVEVLTPLIEMVSQIFQAIMDVVMPIIQAIVDFMREHWDQIRGVVEGAMQAIQAVIEAVMGIIKGIINVVMGILTGDWKRAWEGIKGIALSIWNGIKGAAEGIWNGLKAALSLVWDGIKAAFGAMWDAMEGLWDSAAAWISGIGDKIKGFFKNAGEWLVQIGRDIINGLWNGLKEIWDKVSGWISGIGSKIKNGFKAMLGIGSPSRVMMELGRFTMEGLRVGLETGLRDVLRSVDLSGARITYAMSGALAGTASSAPVVVPAASPSTYNIVNNYQVTVDASKLDRPDFEALLESIQAAERMRRA